MNTTTKISFLHKAAFLIGLLSAMGIALGWLGTILNIYPGSLLFSISFIALNLFFLPYSLLRFRSRQLVKSKLSTAFVVLGISASLLTGIAVLLKLGHFAGSTILFVAGISIFSFGFLPVLFLLVHRRWSSV